MAARPHLDTLKFGSIRARFTSGLCHLMPAGCHRAAIRRACCLRTTLASRYPDGSRLPNRCCRLRVGASRGLLKRKGKHFKSLSTPRRFSLRSSSDKVFDVEHTVRT